MTDVLQLHLVLLQKQILLWSNMARARVT